MILAGIYASHFQAGNREQNDWLCLLLYQQLCPVPKDSTGRLPDSNESGARSSWEISEMRQAELQLILLTDDVQLWGRRRIGLKPSVFCLLAVANKILKSIGQWATSCSTRRFVRRPFILLVYPPHLSIGQPTFPSPLSAADFSPLSQAA